MDWRRHYQKLLREAPDRKAFYRKEAMRTHPDRGGDAEQFAGLQWAYERSEPPKVCPRCEGTKFITRKTGWGTSKIPCLHCKGFKS